MLQLISGLFAKHLGNAYLGQGNDGAVMGATPLYLAAGFILEEGLALADLARIVESMAHAARQAGVPVVTGDTKVVERGKGDGIFITTTGMGMLPDGLKLGGLASTLNEIAGQAGLGMMLHEKTIPIKPVVSAVCEFLGLYPLYVANEGKLIVICAAQDAAKLLAVMRADPLGLDAAQIGEVIADTHHFVQLTTAFGGRRIVDWLVGEQLPRIC